ncbi:MAG: hypothetical protein ACYDBB_07390 [Armatimonadota bacterium]
MWDVKPGQGMSFDLSDFWRDKHRDEDRRQGTELKRLEEQLEKLLLVNFALWTLAKEAFQLTDANLAERVEMFDMADGMVNGKLRIEARNCPQCSRMISANHFHCQYCGFNLPDEEGFSLFLYGAVAPPTVTEPGMLKDPFEHK